MVFDPDLTPYEYYPGESHMLNVGWLSRDRPYHRGPVSLAFAHELNLMATAPVELTRGYHVCDFCEPPADIIAQDPQYEQVWEMFRSGNGELHIQGETGIIYCAPALIMHSVSEHGYQPPAEFISAVLYQRELRCNQFGA